MSFSASETTLTVASIVFSTGLFIFVQGAALRAIRPKRLLLFSLIVYSAWMLVFLWFEYLLIGQQFLSGESFRNYSVIVFIGSMGMCALYTFLGPATADRSATTHMMVFLLENGSTLEATTLTKAFDANAFVAKRFAECAQAGIVEINGERISLTAKGSRLAKMFAGMIAICQIGRLPGFFFSFRFPT